MTVRHLVDHAHASRGAAMGAGHVGLGTGLIDEQKLLDRNVLQLRVPQLPGGFYVRTILLSGVEALFFNTSPSFFSHSLIDCRLTGSCNASWSSARVASG